MAELTPLYMDISNVYSGDELGLPYRDIISEGIVAATDLAVTQHAGAAGLSVDIAKGAAWILGDTNPDAQPVYRVRNDATVNLGISPDASNPRIVLIVGQITDATFAGATRQWQLQAIHGTPAASPVAPALPNSAILLAQVAVAAGATSIVNANIADKRTRAAVGGGQVAGGLVKLWDSVEAGVVLPAATITTPTLSQAFKHLRVQISGRGDAAASTALFAVRVNGDAGSNYARQQLTVTNATISGSATDPDTSVVLGNIPAATAPASSVGSGGCTVLDYVGGAFKPVKGDPNFYEGSASAAGCGMILGSGLWKSVAPVTALTFILSAGNFAAGTRITIYGEA